MNRRRLLLATGVVLLALIVGLAIRKVRVYSTEQLRAQQNQLERPAPVPDGHRGNDDQAIRHDLFRMLQPVSLSNCQLERFGETHDGGYLMCANLLGDVQSGYSYGIAGYDKWGCDISTKLKIPVHQYDCFDTTRPACPGGDTVFHPECVGPNRTTHRGRVFDTISNHLAKNGDATKRIVMKIDVEGAEWETFLHAPDELLNRIDQLAVEFHWFRAERNWQHGGRHQKVVRRLREFFHVAHIHFNNFACVTDLDPFPAWAFEVLFVSKRLGVVDPSRPAGGVHPLDAPNDPSTPDCQPAGR